MLLVTQLISLIIRQVTIASNDSRSDKALQLWADEEERFAAEDPPVYD